MMHGHIFFIKVIFKLKKVDKGNNKYRHNISNKIIDMKKINEAYLVCLIFKK